MRSFKYFLLATTLVTFLLLVIGNLVRVSGASLGCPDWPTCYGQWILPFSHSQPTALDSQPFIGLLTQIQLAHRAAAVLSGLLLVISALWATFRFRSHRLIIAPLNTALIVMGIEIFIGRGSFEIQNSGITSIAHLALALIVLALITFTTVIAFYSVKSPVRRLVLSTQYNRWTLLAVGLTFFLMLSGVGLAISGGSQACSNQILCWNLTPSGLIQMIHRLLTVADSILVAALFIFAWKNSYYDQSTLSFATGFGLLFFGQVLIGSLKVVRGMPVDLVWLHAATSIGLWVCLIGLTVVSGLSKGETESAYPIRVTAFSQRMRDFITLSKPIIVALLLVTTYAGMVVGGRHLPSAALTFWTLLGGALAAGGASAINQYIDRDLDKNMQRTAKRPLAAGRMAPAEGLAFGIGLCILAFFILAGFVNLIAALLSFAGMVYYILLYSIFLKRATVQNIVIGGGAGALPPLVGWAAATGGLNVPSLFLFAIIFFWTPPHFWALALVRMKDYARAGVPMLPVIKGEQVTRTQILIYTLELVGLTLLMPLFKLAGSFYLVSAVGLGAILIAASWRVYTRGGNKAAWMMYRYSSMYLTLLFLAMVLDVFI